MRSKLLSTLNLFSEQELIALRKFINSPYFNSGAKSSNYIILYETLQNQILNGEFSEFGEQELYRIVFSDENFISGKLEKLKSGLLRLIEQFIEIHFAESLYDQPKKTLGRAIFFRGRQANKSYQATIKKLRTSLYRQKIKDDRYFYNKFLYEEEIEQFNGQFNARVADLNLPNTLKNLDVYYLYNRLRITVFLLAQKSNTKVDINSSIKLLDHISDLIETGDYLQIPIIKIYHHAYKLLRLGENHHEFLEYRKLLNEASPELPPHENKNLQTLLRFYAIGQYNRGEKQYLHQAFVLFKEHLAKEYLYFKNKILPATLQTIVVLGLRNKEYDWVYHFLQNHRKRITGTKQPEEVFKFNLAKYYFHIGNYEKASESLDDFYEDIYYKIGAKQMEIMIFFNQKSPLVEPKLDAFKIYIFRLSKKKLPPNYSSAINSFIDILRQIINPNTIKNKARIDRIKNHIEDKKFLSERTWLLEKLEEQWR